MMQKKSKWGLFCSIFQLVIGILAIAAFAVLAIGGEVMPKWIVTLILAIAFVVMGIFGIVDYKRD